MFPSPLRVVICAIMLVEVSLAIKGDQLGIEVNVALANSARNVGYGSIIQIPGLRDWTDEEIVDLAFEARGATLSKFAETKLRNDARFEDGDSLPKKKPGATSTMVIGNTAYIASSTRGGFWVYKSHEPGPGSYWSDLNEDLFQSTDPKHPCKQVQKALVDCEAIYPNENLKLNVGHKNGASCGEPMAAMAFCATHSQGTLEGAKIVTITDRGPKNDLEIVAPCRGQSDPQKARTGWGCLEFLDKKGLNMHVIPETTKRGRSPSVQTADIAITYAVYPGT